MRLKNCFIVAVLEEAALRICSICSFTTCKRRALVNFRSGLPSFSSSHKAFAARNDQRGFLMPMALFVLVAMAALAMAITRFGASSFSAAVQETISVQTLYAAESGAQYALNRILYNTNDVTVADARCAALASTSLNFSASSLTSCSVEIGCGIVSGAGGSTRVYRIQSDAQCGNGNLITFRSLEVAANY